MQLITLLHAVVSSLPVAVVVEVGQCAGLLGPSHQSVGEQALVAAVLGTGAAQESLVPALMNAYAAADHVVGYALRLCLLLHMQMPITLLVTMKEGGKSCLLTTQHAGKCA